MTLASIKDKDSENKYNHQSVVLPEPKKQSHKPPLPSMFITNLRSINKWNELDLLIKKEKQQKLLHSWRHGCINLPEINWLNWQNAQHFVGTETKLLAGVEPCLGFLCFYVHNWCAERDILDNHYLTDLVYLNAKCSLFIFLRSFPS